MRAKSWQELSLSGNYKGGNLLTSFPSFTNWSSSPLQEQPWDSLCTGGSERCGDQIQTEEVYREPWCTTTSQLTVSPAAAPLPPPPQTLTGAPHIRLQIDARFFLQAKSWLMMIFYSGQLINHRDDYNNNNHIPLLQTGRQGTISLEINFNTLEARIRHSANYLCVVCGSSTNILLTTLEVSQSPLDALEIFQQSFFSR